MSELAALVYLLLGGFLLSASMPQRQGRVSLRFSLLKSL